MISIPRNLLLAWALVPGMALAQAPANSTLMVPTHVTTDASLANVAGGLTASGLVNVLAYASGIPIGDGNIHTVQDAPVGSPFNGVTTLAGLAAIRMNGASPFWFLTDNGTLTGPLCTYGSAINCFTSATGAYHLTDADTKTLDIAWLAIQAALVNRLAYIPAGTYQVGTARPLPLMVPINVNINQIPSKGERIAGDGPSATILMAGSSFGTLPDASGTVIPLLSCGDPGATPINALGRWGDGTPDGGNSGQCTGHMSSVGLWGSPYQATGLSSTYRTDGIAFGARFATTDVESSWFYHDATMVGDHTLHVRLHLGGGVYGMYWAPPNHTLVGDMQFIDLNVAGQSFASMDMDGAATMGGFFDGETYLNAGLYAIYGEPNGCAPVAANVLIKNLMTEYLGLGVAEDGHNWTGTTYNDAAKCRGLFNFNTEHWFTFFNNGSITPGANGRRRRATLDVSSISGRIRGIDINGALFMPIDDGLGSGPAGVALINVNNIGDAGSAIGLDLEGAMLSIFAQGVGVGPGGATVPVLSSQAVGGPGLYGSDAHWEQPGGESGRFISLMTAGSYTSTMVGDVLESLAGAYGQVAPAGYSANQPIAGVVQQSGLTTGQMVPIQDHGQAFVAGGYHYGSDGFQKKSTGIGGRTTFVGGSGGVPGTYTITASAGCAVEPTFTVTVTAAAPATTGGITAVTSPNSTSPTGCTTVPTVPLTSIPGLAGASVTPQWPAAGETTASGPGDGVVFSYGLQAGSGNLATGTQMLFSRLVGGL